MSLESTRPPLRIVARGARTPISSESGALCRFESLDGSPDRPWLVRPSLAEVDLPAWIRTNRGVVEERLRERGALLFRGFDVHGASSFEDCIKALSGSLLEYEYRSTPRTRVAGKIYTSTEYTASRSIPMHNEMSYARAWPLKLWFYVVTPAPTGGETPLADSHKVYARLPAAVRRKFETHGVLYVRNYGHGVDLPWQEVFQTTDRSDVERLCRRAGMEFEWRSGDRLTTRHVCQATEVHPQNGEPVWFNQAHLFHISSLDQASRDVLLGRFAERELPRNAYYGDGSPIETSVLDEIRDAYQQQEILFRWQTGDVLLVDNMRMAHGRRPYDGPRRLLAGMAERFGRADVCVDM